MKTPLTDPGNLLLLDVGKYGDALETPAYRRVLGLPDLPEEKSDERSEDDDEQA